MTRLFIGLAIAFTALVVAPSIGVSLITVAHACDGMDCED